MFWPIIKVPRHSRHRGTHLSRSTWRRLHLGTSPSHPGATLEPPWSHPNPGISSEAMDKCLPITPHMARLRPQSSDILVRAMWSVRRGRPDVSGHCYMLPLILCAFEAALFPSTFWLTLDTFLSLQDACLNLWLGSSQGASRISVPGTELVAEKGCQPHESQLGF